MLIKDLGFDPIKTTHWAYSLWLVDPERPDVVFAVCRYNEECTASGYALEEWPHKLVAKFLHAHPGYAYHNDTLSSGEEKWHIPPNDLVALACLIAPLQRLTLEGNDGAPAP